VIQDSKGGRGARGRERGSKQGRNFFLSSSFFFLLTPGRRPCAPTLLF